MSERSPSPRRARDEDGDGCQGGKAADSTREGRDRNHDQRDNRDRDSNRRGDRDSDRPRDRGGDRDRRPRGRGGGGFKWKDERRDRQQDRDRDDRRRDDRPYRRRSRSPRRRDQDGGRSRDRDNRDRDRDRDRAGGSGKKETKPAPAPAAPAGGEEMIIVHINDRLGTKAAIPCFPSDRIKEFRIMVAQRIGRDAPQILLKRQGERPFKDQLSLIDYGISNGAQIDLEVDTGD